MSRYEKSRHLSQRASLVGEDVLDLAEVVRQIPASGDCGLVGFLIPNVRVKIDERCLTGAHEFDGYVERNGDDSLETEGTSTCYL